uniref:Uncharacterized protein n=1 Tax=Trieres chinensis TaxID=1514140 RepID=A0A7S2EU33_TRICV|mmetsp:Transcript_39644/g.80910  ORF Transcript_39644/g.80910 Transcript_39644/m.80910 type:complete len:176 (+) Transcript_39644:1-528(+)
MEVNEFNEHGRPQKADEESGGFNFEHPNRIPGSNDHNDTTPPTPSIIKKMGIAMVITSIGAFIPNYVSFLFVLLTMIISSILTCGLCCAGDYKLKPRARKLAIAILTSHCLVLILYIILFVAFMATAINMASEMDAIDPSSIINGLSIGSLAVGILILICNVLAVVCAVLFTRVC